ncbi:uncharacterized protein LOC124898413 [Capsicum annuum]|uniref:uncharacterized protein LOC124898413 n=1 Tax=Capsicum annuum TaxID=4072 RepID=UPI001FB0B7A0|nr:uncharacterized protein LOC124898413 [Capsicum annuum]
MDATIKRLQSLFYWKDLMHDTKNFVNRYDIYQRQKYDMAASSGLLQPLFVPDGVLTDVYLDFVERLPKSKKNKDWCSYLPLAEWWYNTTYRAAIKCTPYNALYGHKPLINISYLTGEASTEMVDRSLAAREVVIELLRFYKHRAQQKMKDIADKHKSERSFAVGNWVYLKLQPYRHVALAV